MTPTCRVVAALAALVVSQAALANDGIWHGQSLDETDHALAVEAVLADPDQWLGQSLVVTGRITDVCTHRGCWAVFEDGGQMLRIKASDHSFALPDDYRGQAVAHGMLERVEITPEHARHLVDDDGADPSVLELEYEYRLDALGVRFLQ